MKNSEKDCDLPQTTASPSLMKFTEVINIEEIQQIQDAFSAATGVASIITDVTGGPITKPSNFSRLCNMIRSSHAGVKKCMYSDSVIGRPSPEGPNIQRCLSGGLVDAGASIFFNGRHVANWLIGQVIVEDSQIEKIVKQATEIGVSPEELQIAIDEIPRMPLEKFKEISKFLFLMANQISSLAVQSTCLLAEINERNKIETALRQEQERLAKLNEDLQQAYESTIEGWALALELRDLESSGHSHRVTDLALRLAARMGIGRAELGNIRRGALLHDIGKLSIPDSILLKPGPLTDEEWKIMKLHTLYAEKLLEPIPFLHSALDIPLYHHEKWDGTGYPKGLKSADIPIAARIFAIVDVYDALISDRCYRKAWLKRDVLQYIQSQTGIHFDPEVVAAFLGVIEN